MLKLLIAKCRLSTHHSFRNWRKVLDQSLGPGNGTMCLRIDGHSYIHGLCDVTDHTKVRCCCLLTDTSQTLWVLVRALRKPQLCFSVAGVCERKLRQTSTQCFFFSKLQLCSHQLQLLLNLDKGKLNFVRVSTEGCFSAEVFPLKFRNTFLYSILKCLYCL